MTCSVILLRQTHVLSGRVMNNDQSRSGTTHHLTVGTAATTRVLIESADGVAEWGTVGVHENIVEASLQALVDSFEFALLPANTGATT